MSAIVMSVTDVRPHGKNLSIVTVSNGMEVVANRKEDGSFRWEAGEPVVYVSEGSIVPDDVLKERGYWDEEKNRGLLEGNKRNRVKMRRMADFESRGLLFKTREVDSEAIGRVMVVERGLYQFSVSMGQDVTDMLGITEHTAG